MEIIVDGQKFVFSKNTQMWHLGPITMERFADVGCNRQISLQDYKVGSLSLLTYN